MMTRFRSDYTGCGVRGRVFLGGFRVLIDILVIFQQLCDSSFFRFNGFRHFIASFPSAISSIGLTEHRVTNHMGIVKCLKTIWEQEGE